MDFTFEEEIIMASHNEYQGYVKLPNKKLYRENIRFDFNPHVHSGPDDARLRGFTMRMFVLSKDYKDQQPELSVTLTTEQWLDLIDSMKQQFEQAKEIRKNMDRHFE